MKYEILKIISCKVCDPLSSTEVSTQLLLFTGMGLVQISWTQLLGLNHLKYSENRTNVQAVLAIVGERLSNQSLDDWNTDLNRESAKREPSRNKPATYVTYNNYLCKPLSYNV